MQLDGPNAGKKPTTGEDEEEEEDFFTEAAGLPSSMAVTSLSLAAALPFADTALHHRTSFKDKRKLREYSKSLSVP